LKKEKQKTLWAAVGVLAAYVLWTAAVRIVDVRSIGPQGSVVGFAGINGAIHRLTGVHMVLYTVTDWLGLVPLGVVIAFGLFGLAQWIKRKRLQNVDRSILLLGGFYAAVLAAYVLFEKLAINYRPVLIGGCLEVSYPSSTTLLVLSVMPTAAMQLKDRIADRRGRRWAVFMLWAFAVFMVIARFISGVHWFTDIVGGVLLSAGLVLLYHALTREDAA